MGVFSDTNLYQWLLLPLSIFLARILTETLGTLRIMFLARGNRIVAPLLGFFEVLIWVIIIGQVMQNLENFLCYVAYAGGFAVGSYAGMVIETKLALGVVMINVITRKNTKDLQESLRENNYGFTKIAGRDIDGLENILFIIAKRKELENVIKIIKKFNPCAFFSIEDIRGLNEGKYPLKDSKNPRNNFHDFLKKYFFPRKSKNGFPKNLEMETELEAVNDK
jgi:uncharacterized protein YebE (UPF0316 family)